MSGHPGARAALRVGDRVRMDDRLHTVVGLSGTTVRLLDEAGAASLVLLPHLLASEGFERIDYHSELQVVRTSTVKEVAHQGRLLTLLNRREHGARRGLIISGERTTGRTTALRQLGRLHELRTRQRYPDTRRVPVVYVTAPPKGSPRKLASSPGSSACR